LNLPQVNSLFWQQCESLIWIYLHLMYLLSSHHCVQRFWHWHTTDSNYTFILKKIWVRDSLLPKQTCTFANQLFTVLVTVLWVLKQLISSTICDCRAIITVVICEVSC
jgi:hypothetical protein